MGQKAEDVFAVSVFCSTSSDFCLTLDHSMLLTVVSACSCPRRHHHCLPSHRNCLSLSPLSPHSQEDPSSIFRALSVSLLLSHLSSLRTRDSNSPSHTEIPVAQFTMVLKSAHCSVELPHVGKGWWVAPPIQVSRVPQPACLPPPPHLW